MFYMLFSNKQRIFPFINRDPSIYGPFSSCPFLDGMLIFPMKSNPKERCIILDLNFLNDWSGVNDFVSKNIILVHMLNCFILK
jgi:hypothetical protein